MTLMKSIVSLQNYYPIINETNFKHLFIKKKKTDYIKTKSVQNKITSRKVLKL
jgi:hypothetical protein